MSLPGDVAPDFDVRDMIDGAALLASTANVVMQLARPGVGYGVLESTVEGSQVMRHPVRRIRTTLTYLSVALLGTPEERAVCRRQVNRSHASVRSAAGSPVSYSAFDPRLQLWVAACLYRGVTDVHALLHGPVDDATAGTAPSAAPRYDAAARVIRYRPSATIMAAPATSTESIRSRSPVTLAYSTDGRPISAP